MMTTSVTRKKRVKNSFFKHSTHRGKYLKMANSLQPPKKYADHACVKAQMFDQFHITHRVFPTFLWRLLNVFSRHFREQNKHSKFRQMDGCQNVATKAEEDRQI